MVCVLQGMTKEETVDVVDIEEHTSWHVVTNVAGINHSLLIQTSPVTHQ
jgi:hypothetical protein